MVVQVDRRAEGGESAKFESGNPPKEETTLKILGRRMEEQKYRRTDSVPFALANMAGVPVRFEFAEPGAPNYRRHH